VVLVTSESENVVFGLYKLMGFSIYTQRKVDGHQCACADCGDIGGSFPLSPHKCKDVTKVCRAYCHQEPGPGVFNVKMLSD
jgi:hypothetical protein